MFRKCLIIGLQNLAAGSAYFAVGILGKLHEFAGYEFTRALFLGAGLAVAALMVLGVKVWPGIFLGAFMIALSLGRTPAVGAALGGATSVTYLVAYLLLRRADFDVRLDRVKDVFSLVVLAAGVGMIPAAVIRTSAIVLLGLSPRGDFLNLTLATWVSLAMGVLVVAPALLVARKMRWPPRLRPYRVAEAVLLLAVTAAVTLVVTDANSDRELLFLVFPPLIWAAWRFQLTVSALCNLMVSSMVVYLVFNDQAQPVTDSELITLGAFLVTVSVSSIFLAAAVTERNRANDRIGNATSELVSALRKLEDRGDPEDPLVHRARRWRDGQIGPHD
ncbi:MASE1 domain-containing protein [Actinopolymorpha pittospori]